MKQIGTQGNLNTTLVGNTQIPVPSISEQRKIVKFLTAIDKKLELQREKKARLERVKRGMMNELLAGKRRVKVGG